MDNALHQLAAPAAHFTITPASRTFTARERYVIPEAPHLSALPLTRISTDEQGTETQAHLSWDYVERLHALTEALMDLRLTYDDDVEEAKLGADLDARGRLRAVVDELPESESVA